MKIIKTIEFKYEGDLKDGKMDGFGMISDSLGQCIYEGEFSQGRINGLGKLQNPNLSNFPDNQWLSYEGEFANDSKQGVGLEVYRNGDRYQGQFANDQRNGFGVMTKSNRIFKGIWLDGELAKEII